MPSDSVAFYSEQPVSTHTERERAGPKQGRIIHSSTLGNCVASDMLTMYKLTGIIASSASSPAYD